MSRPTSRAFSDEQIKDIQEQYRNGKTINRLAIENGVRWSTISRIVTGIRQKPQDKDAPPEKRKKLTTSERQDIFQAFAAGSHTISQLAQEYEVSHQLISRIVHDGENLKPLNYETRMRIIEKYEAGMSMAKLVSWYKRDEATIQKVIDGEYDRRIKQDDGVYSETPAKFRTSGVFSGDCQYCAGGLTFEWSGDVLAQWETDETRCHKCGRFCRACVVVDKLSLYERRD